MVRFNYIKGMFLCHTQVDDTAVLPLEIGMHFDYMVSNCHMGWPHARLSTMGLVCQIVTRSQLVTQPSHMAVWFLHSGPHDISELHDHVTYCYTISTYHMAWLYDHVTFIFHFLSFFFAKFQICPCLIPVDFRDFVSSIKSRYCIQSMNCMNVWELKIF